MKQDDNIYGMWSQFEDFTGTKYKKFIWVTQQNIKQLTTHIKRWMWCAHLSYLLQSRGKPHLRLGSIYRNWSCPGGNSLEGKYKRQWHY